VAAWQFELGGKCWRFSDFGMDELDDALVGTGVKWHEFERRPYDSGKALVAFARYLAKSIGYELPARLPSTWLDESGFIKFVEDDLPDTYTDGMPDPKAGDQTME
jgi:hypothetical protein